MTRPLTSSRQARATARSQGQRTYQGQDCADSHGGTRYTSNGACVACAHAQRVAQAKRTKAARVAAGLPTRNRTTLGASLLDDI